MKKLRLALPLLLLCAPVFAATPAETLMNAFKAMDTPPIQAKLFTAKLNIRFTKIFTDAGCDRIAGTGPVKCPMNTSKAAADKGVSQLDTLKDDLASKLAPAPVIVKPPVTATGPSFTTRVDALISKVEASALPAADQKTFVAQLNALLRPFKLAPGAKAPDLEGQFTAIQQKFTAAVAKLNLKH